MINDRIFALSYSDGTAASKGLDIALPFGMALHKCVPIHAIKLLKLCIHAHGSCFGFEVGHFLVFPTIRRVVPFYVRNNEKP